MDDEYGVYLRPLRLEDARTSWRWRNNPEVWKNTGSAPDHYITEEAETEWLRKALADSTARRFAICLKADDRYVGNIYLTDIVGDTAEQQTFIGEPSLWGKGIGTRARAALYEIAVRDLGITRIVSTIRTRNVASLKSVFKLGFTEVSRDAEWVRLEKKLVP